MYTTKNPACSVINLYFQLKEHPFNLRGGGGMVSNGVKIKFSRFADQQKIYFNFSIKFADRKKP